MDSGKTLKVNRLFLLARCTDAGVYKVVLTPPLPQPTVADPKSNEMSLTRNDEYGGLHSGDKDVSGADITVVPTEPPTTWKLKMTRPGGGALEQDNTTKRMEVEDVLLVLGYEWE